MSNIYETLSKSYPPEQGLAIRKRISTSEKGVKYLANVESEGRKSAVFQVDGCIITSGNKCDKLILVASTPNATEEYDGCFVELKGSNISHAIDQLEATINNPIFARSQFQRLSARIVGRSFPANSGNSDMERAKARFKSCYKCNLRGVKSNQTDKL